MDIKINQTSAQIAIRTTPGTMSIEQPPAQLDLVQRPAKLEIDSELPHVIIDQYQCFAESGLKNYIDLTREQAQIAQQVVMETIAKLSSDGDRLMRIENGGNVIADLAAEINFPGPREISMVTMPQSRPKIDIGGKLDIRFDLGGVENNSRAQPVIINYTPSNVEVYMKQMNSISFEYVGNHVDKLL